MVNNPRDTLQRERILEALESGAIKEIFKKSVLADYQIQRKALLTNSNLDPAARQAYIKYGECLRSMIRRMYIDAEIDIPSWFVEEFDL